MTIVSDSATNPVELLCTEFVLDRAKTAARAGRLDEAERALVGLGTTTEIERTRLDLLARVYAQRGRLAEADECWSRVQAADPEDREAARGRAAIEALRERGGRFGRIRAGRVLVPASVVVLLAIAVGVIMWLGPENSVPVRAGPVPGGSANHPPEPALPGGPAGSARQTAAANSLALALSSAGVQAIADGGGVRVRFANGLFSGSDRITPAGVARLRKVGEQLAGLHGRLTVVGHAVAVPGGPSSGGSLVGFARAVVAAKELSAASGWPLTAFTVRAADQSDGPFPDASRNRTVTLVVTPEPAIPGR